MLAVVLYHLQFSLIPGGFVGVDVFFTISGYLIGSIVFEQLRNDNFSIGDFYYRRLRRLFPAYVAMVLATSAIGWFVLLPAEYGAFGKSIVATSTYLSNVLFYMEAGYFDVGSKMKPLLHTWSLAVEEQFYLVFPALGLLAYKYLRSRFFLFFTVLGVISFALACTFIDQDGSAVFYLYPFRAWEMFVGVALAAARLPAPSSRSLSTCIGCIGILSVILPMFLYSTATQFPGLSALPVCVGTALMIYACSHKNVLSEVLSLRLPVFFGKISYSLYLWHWPIVVLYTYAYGDLELTDKIGLLVFVIIVSVISWRFIEAPFRTARKSRFSATKRGTFTSVFATSAGLIVLGFFLLRSDGVPDRLDKDTAAIADVATDFFKDWSDCYGENNSWLPGIEHCTIGTPMDADSFLLIWGDSHAFALKPALDEFVGDNDLHAVVAWRGGCPPVWGLDKSESASSAIEDRACTEQNQRVKQLVTENLKIDSIVLVGRWSYYMHGGGIGIDDHNHIELTPIETSVATGVADEDLFLFAFQNTIQKLNDHGFNPFVVEQPPEFPYLSSSLIARGLFTGQIDYQQTLDEVGVIPYHVVIKRQGRFMALMEELDSSGSATALNTHSYFCTQSECNALYGNKLAYYDNNHIAGSTATSLEHVFTPVVSGERPRTSKIETHHDQQ